MRILQRYLLVDFLVSFALTLSVITFVLCLAVVIRVIDVAARGVSGGLLAQYFLLHIPYMMSFSIPISILTACLLLFGRLSFDGELTAMKACGMSLWSIISPVIIVAVLFSAGCIYINTSVSPRCKEMSRPVKREIGMENPLNLLETGRFVQIAPGLKVRIGSRSDDLVRDIVVYESDDRKSRTIRAQSGKLRHDEAEKALFVDLYKVRMEVREEGSGPESSNPQPLFAEEHPIRIDVSPSSEAVRRKKPSDMTVGELIEKIKDVRKAFKELSPRELAEEKMAMIVEVNIRYAMALSCFAFALIGIPLGMRSRRKESSVGIGIAIGLVFLFFLFTMLAKSMSGIPHLRPDIIVWLPVIFCEAIGFWLIYKQD
jgi:lipopolysaccharide export system permease protein